MLPNGVSTRIVYWLLLALLFALTKGLFYMGRLFFLWLFAFPECVAKGSRLTLGV